MTRMRSRHAFPLLRTGASMAHSPPPVEDEPERFHVPNIKVAAAQLGPIARDESARAVVKRLIELMREAAGLGRRRRRLPRAGADHLLSPLVDRGRGRDRQLVRAARCPTPRPGRCSRRPASSASAFTWATPSSPSTATAPSTAINTAIIVDKRGEIVGKFRKIHIPGHDEVQATGPASTWRSVLRGRRLGFPVFRAFGGIVGMAICNDRRWPETWRVHGPAGRRGRVLRLQHAGRPGRPLRPRRAPSLFHNQLVFQAGCYQNATWAVGVAKAGLEEGFNMIGQSCIVAPSGEIVAHVLDHRGRARRPQMRPRSRPRLQARHLQLRLPPPARAVRADRRAEGRRAAAGLTTDGDGLAGVMFHVKHNGNTPQIPLLRHHFRRIGIQD